MPSSLARFLVIRSEPLGFTVYVENMHTLQTGEKIAAHESPRTTKLYDRTDDQLTPDEVEKLSVRETSSCVLFISKV
jgi:hypothetical protein